MFKCECGSTKFVVVEDVMGTFYTEIDEDGFLIEDSKYFVGDAWVSVQCARCNKTQEDLEIDLTMHSED